MASFDFIEASSKGVEFCWQRASYIFKVAVPVIFVKIFCMLSAFSMSVETGSLAYGLVIFPSYIIEAIFIIGLIRYFTYKEPIYVWGKVVTPPDIKDHKEKPLFFHAPKHRKIPIQAGIASYCLIQLIILLINGTLLHFVDNTPQSEEARNIMTTHEFALGLSIFAATFYAALWAVRLAFLYVPVTLDIPSKLYLQSMKGIKTSIYMMFTMMICIAPIFIMVAASLNILGILFGAGSAPYIIGNAVIFSIGQVIESAIVSIAITYGICNMMFSNKNNEN